MKKTTAMTAHTFLLRASIARVESKSIREWASTKENLPIWLKIAKTAIKNGKNPENPDDVAMFATYIVAVAIG